MLNIFNKFEEVKRQEPESTEFLLELPLAAGSAYDVLDAILLSY